MQRVKIEFVGESKGRCAHIDRRDDGKCYIKMVGESFNPFGMREMGATIVTADRALADALDGQGYSVRVSNPQAEYAARGNIQAVRSALNAREYAALRAYCDARGLSVHAAVKQAVLKMIGYSNGDI